MNQKRYIAVLLAVLVFGALGIFMYISSSSTPSEAAGFAGMQWTSGPVGVDGMKLIAQDGDLKFYEKSTTSAGLGDARVERIVCGFHKDRFYSAMTYFEGRDNLDKVKKALSGKYGEPAELEQSGSKFLWNGTNVDMLLTWDEPSGSGRLICIFKPIQMEAELTR